MKIKGLRPTASNWWYTSWAQQFVRRNFKCLIQCITLQLILNASVNQIECIITLTFRILRSALSDCWWRTQGECITDTSDNIFIYLYLPSSSSQGSVLQLCASSLSPAKHCPPFTGGGLVQVLLRFFIPPPHGTLHSLQSPKSLHPPCTAPGLRPERQLLKWTGKVLYLNTDLVDHSSSIALWFGLIDWLIDWLIDIDWLSAEWLTDWLTDRPTDRLTGSLVH